MSEPDTLLTTIHVKQLEAELARTEERVKDWESAHQAQKERGDHLEAELQAARIENQRLVMQLEVDNVAIPILHAKIKSSQTALDLVSGALVDVATVQVPDDVMKYGEAVRTLVDELQAARERNDATYKSYKEIEFEYDKVKAQLTAAQARIAELERLNDEERV